MMCACVTFGELEKLARFGRASSYIIHYMDMVSPFPNTYTYTPRSPFTHLPHGQE